MKIVIAILLTAALSLGLLACASNSYAIPEPAEATTAESTTVEEATTEEIVTQTEPVTLASTTQTTTPTMPNRSIPPQLHLQVGAAQPVRAAQLSNIWNTPDGRGFSASGHHPLDFFGLDHCPSFLIVEPFIIDLNLSTSAEIALQFGDNLPPETMRVHRWNAALAGADRRMWNNFEVVTVSNNIITVPASTNDYIFEVRADWPQGYQFYTFRINNTR